jgi:carboxypeptidase C (cathepsin A)
VRIDRRLTLACAAWLLVATAAVAAEPDKKDEKADDTKHSEAPKNAVTHHHISIGGAAINYTATAGTIELRNEKDELIGRMFAVAYTAEGRDARTRPVTFCFNGGPGSATIWLHMGSFGPMRVATTDGAPTPPAPYNLVENASSLLDRTDLVFIDAMGTGYSRIIGKGEGKDFYGTDPDIDAFAQFIQRWLTQNSRWNSPKFLLGESYGTTRAAGLLNKLEDLGTAFNGVVMVSSYLNAFHDFNGPAFSSDVPYALYLPTMAATAWYHKKLEPQPADLPAFLAEVRKYALGEYMQALAAGDQISESTAAATAEKLHRYTGMPISFLRSANLRIDPNRFQKELLRGERRTIGRLDARFRGIDHDAAGEGTESDAADEAIAPAFVASFNNYIRTDLKYDSGEEMYRPNDYGEVGRSWDDHHRSSQGRADMPDVAEDLRNALSRNPNLKVFFANGYYDFATPFFETEYTVSHMGLDPSLAKNLHWGYYESGHMIYIHPDALSLLKGDLGKFYDQTLAH